MLNDLNEIKAQIIDFLDNSNSLIILGIGNDIRGDDGLGPYIINQLTELNENSLENKEIRKRGGRILLFFVFTGYI